MANLWYFVHRHRLKCECVGISAASLVYLKILGTPPLSVTALDFYLLVFWPAESSVSTPS